MSIPKIVEHKIIKLRKPDGSTQYLLTLPKEYAETLTREGADSLIIVFNKGLGAFPKIPGFTEKALTQFMQAHPELQRLFNQSDKQTEKRNKRLQLRHLC